MKVKVEKTPARILDFDLETMAAGFADPQWVPQKILVSAWSWVGSDEIHYQTCGPMGFFKPEIRARSLEQLLEALSEATMVTGHNLLRFDLSILQAESLRLGLGPLWPMKVQDTMRFVKTKGLKKGQDNLGVLLGAYEKKLQLNWQEWDDAYAEDGWPVPIERCVSDVRMHKEIREAMLLEGWLKPPVEWRP